MDRIGVGFWGGMSVNELIDCMSLADQKGYESAYLIESFADAFGVLSACARETTNIILATGVATVFTRNPTTIATAAATVDAISEGRFRLGLGIGHSEIHQARDNPEPGRPFPFDRPLRRLRETTEVVGAILKGAVEGKLVNYTGQIFQITDYEPWLHPYRDTIPFYFGALSEKTLDLAGEIADGVLPIFVPLDMVPDVLAAVRRGAKRAGRDPASIDIGCYLPCCVSTDQKMAKRAMQYVTAIHVTAYVLYARYFERRGYEETVAQMRTCAARGDMDGAAALVDDEMVDAFAVYGSAEQCHHKIAQYRAAGVTLPIVYPIHPTFTNYLPDAAARDGIRYTIEALATE